MSLRRFALIVLPLLLSLYTQARAVSTGTSVYGTWRFTHATAAPWGGSMGSSHGNSHLIGKTLRLAPGAMTGPTDLNCGKAQMEENVTPAEGLFQGNLPSPAVPAAQALGITKFPVAGLSVTCDEGIFEFHRVDADTLLLGLNNSILTLSRAPGALAGPASPEGVVERFLEQHFNGDMGFTPENMQEKSGWLTDRLKQRITRYFAQPTPGDEVPAIDGDPFTYSQEYPLRFAVGKAKLVNSSAQVAVRFADAYRNHVVTYVLMRDGTHWKLDDLRYEDGTRLVRLLK